DQRTGRRPEPRARPRRALQRDAVRRPAPARVTVRRMSRLDPVPRDEWPDSMRDALAAMRPPVPRYQPAGRTHDRPQAGNTLDTFAHHPALAQAFLTFNGHVLYATTLTERQREILVLRVAACRESAYLWAQHLFMGRDAGLTDEEMGRIAFGPEAPFFTPLE